MRPFRQCQVLSGSAAIGRTGTPVSGRHMRAARPRLYNRHQPVSTTAAPPFMAYSHTNSKGVVYHLHANERATKSGKVTKLYFFSRDIRPDKAVAELPADRTVAETATGMLVVKRAA